MATFLSLCVAIKQESRGKLWNRIFAPLLRHWLPSRKCTTAAAAAAVSDVLTAKCGPYSMGRLNISEVVISCFRDKLCSAPRRQKLVIRSVPPHNLKIPLVPFLKQETRQTVVLCAQKLSCRLLLIVGKWHHIREERDNRTLTCPA